MINEKDSIKTILEGRGVISNGVFDEVRFKKLVTEPWLYTKTLKYGFDKMNEHNTQDVDNEPVTEEVVEIQEPITVVEKVVEPQEVVETSTESVLLEEDLKEEIEEPIIDECPIYEAAPVVVEEPTVEVVEEPTVEVVEEPAEEEVVTTPKKKTSKKK